MRAILVVVNIVVLILLILLAFRFSDITGFAVKDTSSDNVLLTFCDLDASIKCVGYDVTSDKIKITLKNEIPYDLEKVKIRILNQETNKEICKLTCENCQNNKMIKNELSNWEGNCEVNDDIFLGRISMDFEIQDTPINVIGTIKDKV